MKLFEEFKLYEELWEGATGAETSNNTTALSKSRMYALPDGTEININNSDARSTVAKQIRELWEKSTGIGYRGDVTEHRVYDALGAINSCLDKLDKPVTMHHQTAAKHERENKAIIDKLLHGTDIATKVDLDDLLGQLNAYAASKDRERLQRHIKFCEDDLSEIYKEAGMI
jgi:hypothetical protein